MVVADEPCAFSVVTTAPATRVEVVKVEPAELVVTKVDFTLTDAEATRAEVVDTIADPPELVVVTSTGTMTPLASEVELDETDEDAATTAAVEPDEEAELDCVELVWTLVLEAAETACEVDGTADDTKFDELNPEEVVVEDDEAADDDEIADDLAEDEITDDVIVPEEDWAVEEAAEDTVESPVEEAREEAVA